MPMAVVPPPGPSDDQLIERFARGDPRGLDELFQRYRLVAYRVAYRLLGNEADALDAVQDGFVKTGAHLALADIQESIRELRHYRATLFAPQFGGR